MDRAGLITLEQARAAGLSFDEPEPRACPHCGAALDPLGAALAGRVAWVSAAPCPCEGAASEREAEARRRAALAAKEEAARREKALSRAGIPRRYWAAEADRGNLSAEAVRSLAGMPKERQGSMAAHQAGALRLREERGEGPGRPRRAHRQGREARRRLPREPAREPERGRPLAAARDGSHDGALRGCGHRCPKAPYEGLTLEIQQVAYGVRHRVGRP